MEKHNQHLRDLKVIILHLSNSRYNATKLLESIKYYHKRIKSILASSGHTETDAKELDIYYYKSKGLILTAKQYLQDENINV